MTPDFPFAAAAADSFLAAAYDYPLPPSRIAQHPVEPRSAARLLVSVDGGTTPTHLSVADLPSLLHDGDVLVVNETKVLPARLRLRKATGGAAEVLLLEPLGDDRWTALVRPGRRLPDGTLLFAAAAAAAAAAADDDPHDPHDPPSRSVRVSRSLTPENPHRTGEGPVVEVLGEHPGAAEGERVVRLLAPLDDHGTMPLPPYITEPLADPDRYQTVYARTPGSVAAPTAGLHLTDEVLDEIRRRGVPVHKVDLAVGIGTFRPITADRIDDHRMHTERYRVPPETLAAVTTARRTIAVGTTTVRALESAIATGNIDGRTDLFIRPGFPFKAVDVMLTNFHLPRSSLLVLLAAFVGTRRWRALYDAALTDDRYRFLSFGDAMLVSRAAA